LESIGYTILAACFILIVGYVLIALVILSVGMLAGLLARHVLWLTSKVMGLFGVQWVFRPYRRVLVLEMDVAYESREIWEGVPDDWMAFDDEWLIGTVAAALMWPVYVFMFVSWPIRRFASS
jgi:hypothetical protein